ncbi:MAG TPA: two-component regulator propeller domain-containing protein [Candidatus Binatia bacterium]|nr:two-component regulator propeller domain-containing protein [Candidatus Binatia bacterium]
MPAPQFHIRLVAILSVLLVATAAGATGVAEVPVADVDATTVTLPTTDGHDLRFTRLSSERGLSQTRVAQIVQDDQGFLWFGTQHGLNRFDGYECKVFKHDPDRPDGLSGVFVYALFKDRSGALWVGTDQFLDRFDPVTETFTHHRLSAQPPIVINISQDGAGILWLATHDGLYRLDPMDGRISRVAHDPNDPRSLSSSDVKSTAEDRAGTFWVATSEGIDAFDRATGHVMLHIPLRVSVREFSVHEDRFGVLWVIYGSGNGLAVFDRATSRLTRYSFYPEEPSDTALTGVYAALEDRDGTMWFASMGAGLLRFDRENRRFVRYRNRPGDLESLAENRVIALFEDREGNIWTGLHAMVPNVVVRKSLPFAKLLPGTAVENSLGENLVNAIYEDRQGTLWMGAGGALARVDRESGHVTPYVPTDAGDSTEVLTMIDDASGELWVGTLGHGLTRFDRSRGSFRAYRHDPNDPGSISNDIVTRLHIDRAGTMWAASWDGLNRFDPITGRSTVYKRDPTSRGEAYFSIAENTDGRLWLGSTSGLYRFDPASGRFEVFRHDPDDRATLSDNTVNTVHVDRSGTLWIGTQNGLNRRDPTTGVFTAFYERDGLPGAAVSCILEDDAGHLWMSTNDGIARLTLADGTFATYSVADGLPGGDLTGWNACSKSASGEMFFGGFAGATAFRPDRVEGLTYVPPVVFTEFRLAGAPVTAGAASPLARSITTASSLTLSHEQTAFSLAFSALSFASPTTNRYRYRLAGLDAQWREVRSDQRVANYTTLPAGVYELQVQGATSRGPWGGPGTRLRIEVLPPWWNTWWFRATYAAALLLLLVAAYYVRLRQLAQRFEMRLEERVAERTRIARELHDSLLQGFQGLMFRLQAVRDLLPGRATEAIVALDQALDRGDQAIAEGRDAVQDLRSSADGDLVQALTALGDELAPQGDTGASTTFRLVVEGHPRSLDPIVRDEVYRIAREALRNAFRHAKASRVETEVVFGDRQVSLRIRDDGRGIDPGILDQGRRAGHWGLPGMTERARTFGGRLDVWSQQRAGTEIELTIPAAVAYGGASAHGRWRFRRKQRPTHDA